MPRGHTIGSTPLGPASLALRCMPSCPDPCHPLLPCKASLLPKFSASLSVYHTIQHAYDAVFDTLERLLQLQPAGLRTCCVGQP